MPVAQVVGHSYQCASVNQHPPLRLDLRATTSLNEVGGSILPSPTRSRQAESKGRVPHREGGLVSRPHTGQPGSQGLHRLVRRRADRVCMSVFCVDGVPGVRHCMPMLGQQFIDRTIGEICIGHPRERAFGDQQVLDVNWTAVEGTHP